MTEKEKMLNGKLYVAETFSFIEKKPYLTGFKHGSLKILLKTIVVLQDFKKCA